ncbi:hypothetical protein PAAG_11053 [Paracoccidioides lutzii Pb01]|uniref:Uncharacterized protein n=1 Tax=Paracoccidioides lutzii (strain ATCC MYA-826 / Pb01) TaxID=502779 RepID=A0A0A2VMP5_PARBA|nr:hypothetical protein PAAG_11053 [Paracoccidioides lutzii Pb01]KGQ02104.1 hypothetical protein PAAG_11053 [Paracoccidioides lutzii Pb01]
MTNYDPYYDLMSACLSNNLKGTQFISELPVSRSPTQPKDFPNNQQPGQGLQMRKRSTDISPPSKALVVANYFNRGNQNWGSSAGTCRTGNAASEAKEKGAVGPSGLHLQVLTGLWPNQYQDHQRKLQLGVNAQQGEGIYLGKHQLLLIGTLEADMEDGESGDDENGEQGEED